MYLCDLFIQISVRGLCLFVERPQCMLAADLKMMISFQYCCKMLVLKKKYAQISILFPLSLKPERDRKTDEHLFTHIQYTEKYIRGKTQQKSNKSTLNTINWIPFSIKFLDRAEPYLKNAQDSGRSSHTDLEQIEIGMRGRFLNRRYIITVTPKIFIFSKQLNKIKNLQ